MTNAQEGELGKGGIKALGGDLKKAKSKLRGHKSFYSIPNVLLNLKIFNMRWIIWEDMNNFL